MSKRSTVRPVRVPPPLPAGATLGLIAPGSPGVGSAIASGLRWLGAQGYVWKAGRTVSRLRDSAPRRPPHGLHAGSPRDRAADLHRMWDDRSVDALLCVRGGSGCLGVLPYLDFERLAARPRWLLGMSDVTALQLALLARAGLASISCSMPIQLEPPVPRETTVAWLAAARGAGSARLPAPRGLRVLRAGAARGTLVPANLSLLTRLIGTPYLPSLDRCILVLEDITETPRSIDRMLSHLDLSGVLRKLAGLVLGQFTDCTPRAKETSRGAARLRLEEWARTLGVPVLAGYPYGHAARTRALPVGLPARLTTRPAALDWDDFGG